MAPSCRAALDLGEVVAARRLGSLLPCEHADGHDAVEAQLLERPEERVPGHLALADVEVLVDAHGVARRVGDVAQPGRRAVVEAVRHVHLRQQVACGAHDLGHVPALVEGVRRAVQEAHVRGVDAPDHVHGGDPVLDEVVRVRLEREMDALALEDRQELLHRAPELAPRRWTRLSGRPLNSEFMTSTPELDRDLDGPLPVAHGRLPLVLVRVRTSGTAAAASDTSTPAACERVA